MIKKVVVSKETGVPRMYEYYGEVKNRQIGLPGVDYVGYVILNADTDEPFYSTGKEKVLLTKEEICQMRKLQEAVAKIKENTVTETVSFASGYSNIPTLRPAVIGM